MALSSHKSARKRLTTYFKNECKIVDIAEELIAIEKTGGLTDQEHYLLLKQLDRKHPISIRITPNASQRGVVDFIRAHWHVIEILKNRYIKGPKSPRITKKTRLVKSRNDFIWAHRRLKSSEIRRRVAKKFGQILDYTYISKIIKTESRKRK